MHDLTTLPPEITSLITDLLPAPALANLSFTSRAHHILISPLLPRAIYESPSLARALYHYITHSLTIPLRHLLAAVPSPTLPTVLPFSHHFRNHPPHPLLLACTHQSPSVLELLLPHYPWPTTSCPLRLAAADGNLRILQTLIAHISATSTPPQPDWSGYEYAVRSAAKHCSDANRALEHFLSLGLSAELKQMCLEAAAKSGSAKGVKLLLAEGAELRNDWIPRAARRGRWEVVRALVEAGGLVDAVAGGGTALLEVLLMADKGIDAWPGWVEYEIAEEEGGFLEATRGGWEEGLEQGGSVDALYQRLRVRREENWDLGWNEGWTVEESAWRAAEMWNFGTWQLAKWLIIKGANVDFTMMLAQGKGRAALQSTERVLGHVMDDLDDIEDWEQALAIGLV